MQNVRKINIILLCGEDTLFSACYFYACSKERFHRYFDLFAESGAAERETERWSEGGDDDMVQMPQLDFDDERSYIDEWIDKRLEFLDRLFNINTDITQLYNDNPSTRNETRIYDLSGRIHSTMPSNGIYIVNGKKIRF